MTVKYNPNEYNWKALQNNDLKRLVVEVYEKVPSPEWSIHYHNSHIVFTVRSCEAASDGFTVVFQARIKLNEDSLNAAIESSQKRREECGWSSWLSGGAMTEFLIKNALEVFKNLKALNGKEDNYQAIADLMWGHHGSFTGERYGI